MNYLEYGDVCNPTIILLHGGGLAPWNYFEEAKLYISDEYGVDEEYLFAKHPLFCVFRHSNNRKWFAVVMDVPKNKLGLEGADALDVVNLKCDPILIGSLRKEPGVFPAYHMSKANWVSVALDGSVPDEKIKLLLDMSYDATAPKIKRKAKQS